MYLPIVRVAEVKVQTSMYIPERATCILQRSVKEPLPGEYITRYWYTLSIANSKNFQRL